MNQQQRWLLVLATDAEYQGIAIHLKGQELAFQQSTLITGIGSVNSAIALVQSLEKSLPAGILNLGIAGASDSSELAVGECVVASEEWFADLGVRTETEDFGLEELGFPMTPNQPKPWNKVPIDANLSTQFAASLSLPQRPFISVNQCSGDFGIARLRETKFPRCVENMEGATLATIAARYNVPFVELRAISNRMGDRDKSRWAFDSCFAQLARAVQQLVERKLIQLNHLDQT